MSEEHEKFQVDIEGNRVVITSDFFTDPEDGETWRVQKVDDRRLLLMSEDEQSRLGPPGSAIASCSTEVFKDFLVALIRSQWSGVIYVDTGYGTKQIYFSSGRIVFAASSVIDDRLGEVMYREDLITLDQLTGSAAQVTKKFKFGQVLISSELYTNVDLWSALKLQVQQIIRSLFMVDKVFYQMSSEGVAPTEVVFKRGGEQLIIDSYAYGASFRDFLSRLRAESKVEILVPEDELKEKYNPGTFRGDLLDMIARESNVQMLLTTSKLMDINTIAALASLVHRGFCAITPDIDSLTKASPNMAAIKGKLDAYSFVLKAVQKAFAGAEKKLPVEEILDFAIHINPSDFRTFYLNPDATMHKDCINNIFSQCHSNPARTEFFLVRLESMIQFLLQISGDNLDWNDAKVIRNDYRTISA